MTFEQIMSIVVAAAPSISAIVGIVIAIVKGIRSNKDTSQAVIDKFEEVRQEIFNTKEYSELKSQLVLVHNENLELKKKLNELLTKVDKVARED
jgi:methylthioribose-1-phosphate isomerase